MYQTEQTRRIDRKDHVWHNRHNRGWKCLLCGGITLELPPDYPTADDFTPIRYEPLTKEERALVPFRG